MAADNLETEPPKVYGWDGAVANGEAAWQYFQQVTIDAAEISSWDHACTALDRYGVDFSELVGSDGYGYEGFELIRGLLKLGELIVITEHEEAINVEDLLQFNDDEVDIFFRSMTNPRAGDREILLAGGVAKLRQTGCLRTPAQEAAFEDDLLIGYPNGMSDTACDRKKLELLSDVLVYTLTRALSSRYKLLEDKCLTSLLREYAREIHMQESFDSTAETTDFENGVSRLMQRLQQTDEEYRSRERN